MNMPPLPEGFALMLSRMPALTGLREALGTPPEVSVRVNRAKTAATLPDPVPWAKAGYYLTERPTFTFDPALHQGLYYVQDASSMATAQAVAAAVAHIGMDRPLRFLDACAAPGGKTLGAADALPEGSLVVANEYSRQRLSALTENIAKWGIPAIVTNNDTSAIRGLDGFFDIIAADVPCSGEGMMRKEAEARRQWSDTLVRDCAALQTAITETLWQSLRPGGFMVYSTCTFNRSENEEIVQNLVSGRGAEAMEIPALSAINGTAGAIDAGWPAYRFIPGHVRGEGLFVALLRKPGGATAGAPVKDIKPSKPPFPEAERWLEGEWTWLRNGDTLNAMPANWAGAYAVIEKRMRVVVPGMEAATVKGRDAIPSQPLAMSRALRAGAFARAVVNATEAISYLSRNAMALPDGTPRGIVLLTHGGAPLGFVKNLGNRANNLYPSSWRILSQSPRPVSIIRKDLSTGPQ